MAEEMLLKFLPFLIAGGLLVGAMGIVGWVYTTRLRIKHGYLRAELGSIKDRLGNVEKIVVEDSHKLGAEIEALRGPAN